MGRLVHVGAWVTRTVRGEAGDRAPVGAWQGELHLADRLLSHTARGPVSDGRATPPTLFGILRGAADKVEPARPAYRDIGAALLRRHG